MNKIVTFTIIGVACLGFWLAVVKQCNTEQDTKRSLESLIKAQSQKIKVYQDSSKSWHTESDVAELRNSEAIFMIQKYDKEFRDIAAELNTVKKSLKNLEYLGVTAMASNYSIDKPSVRDTIVIRQTDTIKAKAITYRDTAGWYTFQAINNAGTIQDIKIQTFDSLTTAVTYHRKWFLGRKHYTQEIISHNPHSKVHYARSIVVKK